MGRSKFAAREVNIRFGLQHSHVAGQLQDIGVDSSIIETTPNAFRITLATETLLEIIGENDDLRALYQQGKVKKGGDPKVTVVTIPQDSGFDRLIQEFSQHAQGAEGVVQVQGDYYLSMPTKKLRKLLNNAEDHQVTNLSRAMANSGAETSETLVPKGAFWWSRTRHPQVQQTRADAFIHYVKSGDEPSVAISDKDVEGWVRNWDLFLKPKLMKIGLVALVVAILIPCGMLLKKGMGIFKGHSNKLEAIMDGMDDPDGIDPDLLSGKKKQEHADAKDDAKDKLKPKKQENPKDKSDAKPKLTPEDEGAEKDFRQRALESKKPRALGG